MRALFSPAVALMNKLRYTSKFLLLGLAMTTVMLVLLFTVFTSLSRDIETARQAAEALRPLAGDAAYVLFAMGLVGFAGFVLRRAGIEALRRRVAIDKLDDGHGRGVAVAETRFQHARLAAGPGRVTGSKRIEQLRHHRLVPDAGEGEAARMQIAALGKRNQPIGRPPELLGLGQGRRDLLVLDQRRGKARKQRSAVRCGAVQLAALGAVAHMRIPSVIRGQLSVIGDPNDLISDF